MTGISDELALRAALDDLATGQPDAPVERLSSIRGRHVRRRRAQGIAAGIVTAAAVVGTLFGAGAIGHSASVQPAQQRHLPSWALPWPDHRDPTTSDVLRKQAVAAWRASNNGGTTDSFYAPRQIIWYLTARVLKGADVAVVFEVETDSGDHRLVAGYLSDPTHASLSENWILYDVPAPPLVSPKPTGGHPPIVSFYIPQDAKTGSNFIVLLTSPQAPDAFFGYGGGTHRLEAGFTTALAEHVRDRVQVAVVKGDGKFLYGGDVGLSGGSPYRVPDSTEPQLEQVPELASLPTGANLFDGDAGQGPVFNSTSVITPLQGTVIYARCYGGSSIQVWVDKDTRAQRVTVPCDYREHVLDGPRLLASGIDVQVDGAPKQTHGFGVDASYRVAYRVAVVLAGH